MHVRLRNDGSGELMQVKVGFSWTLLFLSPIFGIPLFARKLYRWARAQFMLCASQFPEWFIDTERAHLLAFFASIFAILSAIYLGFKGNELTVKNLLDKGWTLLDEDDEVTQFAKRKWSLA